MGRLTQAYKDKIRRLMAANVIEHLDEKTPWLEAQKVSAYVIYRNAREALRQHLEHLENVKTKGVEALK